MSVGDAYFRERLPGFRPLTFDDTPWVDPPALSAARVAIVTTAGLRIDSHEIWESDDFGFTVLPRDARDLTMAHASINFDRTGFLADVNVAYPIDRLTEMEESGVIGSVAPNHLSFMGAQRDATLGTLQMDTGPAAARRLKDEGVNLVLLMPVCPGCTRVVGTLSHVLEREGIATVGITSIRGVTEAVAPPRALYCEFPLGRPLGKPGDKEFQDRVLAAAFALLEEPSGPVIADFPDTIEQDLGHPVACFLPPQDTSQDHPGVAEAKALKVAHNRAVETLGRTNVGRVADPAELPNLLAKFVLFADGASLEESGLSVDLLMPAASDIRAYYEEAAMALADQVPSAGQTDKWLYDETAAGALLIASWQRLRTMDLPLTKWIYLVPAAFHDGGKPVDIYK
ncbi:MAG: hypothetical protein ACRDPE_19240 [Solirubrobacterales bacterium]